MSQHGLLYLPLKYFYDSLNLNSVGLVIFMGMFVIKPLRVISKLESQVKQLEHENQARARYVSHSNIQPSGAG